MRLFDCLRVIEMQKKFYVSMIVHLQQSKKTLAHHRNIIADGIQPDNGCITARL
jgi:hypothetical protein